MAKLDDQFAELDTMDKRQLRDRWAKLTGSPAPMLSPALLRLAVGYELQARALGRLSREARQRLDSERAAACGSREIRPGMRLAREHGGKVHVVTIGETGDIVWNGREWNSLSEVARAITGTRWSGPAFFGLRKSNTKAAA